MRPCMEGSSVVCTRVVLPNALNMASAGTSYAQQWAAQTAEGLSSRACLPRPPSLVFDIELDDTRAAAAGSNYETELGTTELKRWLAPGSTGEFKLRNDVEQGMSQCAADSQSALEANQALATYLTRLGYFVHVRTALGGGDGFECLRNLRHVFLAVHPPGAAATTNRFVVDMSFAEQFRIAKPTPRYSSLLACVPEVFVAPEAAVAPLVNFLCQEMAIAFRATGVVLPPWRQTNSMLSKWLPRKSLDEQMPRSISSAGAMPAHQASAGPMPRRSMDTPAAAQVYGHWTQAATYAVQKAAPVAPTLSIQQHAQQQRSKLQQSDSTTTETYGASRRVVKPIVCEPKLKLVGGNFASIGFP